MCVHVIFWASRKVCDIVCCGSGKKYVRGRLVPFPALFTLSISSYIIPSLLSPIHIHPRIPSSTFPPSVHFLPFPSSSPSLPSIALILPRARMLEAMFKKNPLLISLTFFNSLFYASLSFLFPIPPSLLHSPTIHSYGGWFSDDKKQRFLPVNTLRVVQVLWHPGGICWPSWLIGSFLRQAQVLSEVPLKHYLLFVLSMGYVSGDVSWVSVGLREFFMTRISTRGHVDVILQVK